MPKNWCFWTVVLEKTLESPLDWKEIQPVHPKRDQFWVFTGRTDAEAETPVLWPPHAKSWLIWKDPDTGKDWGQEKGMTEDQMVGWHQWLDGHEFEQALGVGDGQGSLACCGSWGHKELDMAEQLNWPELLYSIVLDFAIHSHESAMGVHVSLPPEIPSHLSPPHPSELSQNTGFECPASCIELALVICFT